nr:tRNA uracil 4-sulfurtransferase ThiI [Feifania hominis]
MVKYGEIVLKGQNRLYFDNILQRNIRYRLKSLGAFQYKFAQSTLYITPPEAADDPFGFSESVTDQAVERLLKIFGIASVSVAAVTEKQLAAISQAACERFGEVLRAARTFKVEAKRSDKTFPMTSMELMREVGGDILERFPHLKVDVHNPEVTVVVEIRDFAAYVHAKNLRGAGGLPVGCNGMAALMLSGGIDSPVAGHMMAKRGMKLVGVHFHSYPYTSDKAKEKVLRLAKAMTPYCGGFPVFVVPFTKIQEQIKAHCDTENFTIVMRRLMMKITERIALREGCQAIVTGESLGQVASQTVQGIAVSNAAAERLPVLRPLIGMDKDEIIALSRRIGTFDISIEPYEDCCALFSPKHPNTKPLLEAIEREERKLPLEELIDEAVRGAEIHNISLK